MDNLLEGEALQDETNSHSNALVKRGFYLLQGVSQGPEELTVSFSTMLETPWIELVSKVSMEWSRYVTKDPLR